jgi:hypothetical protein
MGRRNPKFWPEVENDGGERMVAAGTGRTTELGRALRTTVPGRAWRTATPGRALRTAVAGRAWRTAVAGRSSRSTVGRKWANGEREGKNGGKL